MRKTVRRFLDWLDQRFPVKVTVTEKMFCDLNLRQDNQGIRIDQVITRLGDQADRISALEESIRALREALTKAPAQEQARRAAFISSGRMGE